jgi:uncharacterized membrane protein/protein-disulfide isomerase
MSRTSARLVIGFALLGLAASVAASYTHYRLLHDPAYLSFCDVSVVVSCSDVYASRFGSVGGISVAVFGAIWFGVATLLAIAGVAGPRSVRENIPGYLFAGSTVALAAVLYLGYASFVILKLVCMVCLTTYVAVLGLFLVTGAASPVSPWSLPRRAAGDLKQIASSKLAIALSLIFIAGAAYVLAVFPRATGRASVSAPEQAGDERAQFERWYAAQPRVSLDVPADGATVLIVKFNDYQCPPCRQTYMAYKDVLAKHEASRPGAVRLVVKDFPLESECNAGVTSDLHPAGCEAAVAVRLARQHGKAEALEEWLFANQPDLSPQLVEQGAREVGGVTDFKARYDVTLQAVKLDIDSGRAIGVRATPTFVINGVMIQGGLPPQLFDDAIAYELQRAASQ